MKINDVLKSMPYLFNKSKQLCEGQALSTIRYIMYEKTEALSHKYCITNCVLIKAEELVNWSVS